MPARIKSMYLPNGLRVHYRMGTEVEILAKEMFEEDTYFSKGISVQDGAVIFDVGANAGMFVLLLSTLIKNATVYSFEPIPATFEMLVLNAREAKGIDAHPFNVGLSRESKTVEFSYYPRSSVMSSMYRWDSPEFREESRQMIKDIMRRRGGVLKLIADYSPAGLLNLIAEGVRRYYHKEVRVPCKLRTLSEVIDEISPPRIDLLKIDAEGSEFDILEGTRDNHWPLVRQIIVEVHGGTASVDRALAILRKLGFEAWSTPGAGQNSLFALVFGRRP